MPAASSPVPTVGWPRRLLDILLVAALLAGATALIAPLVDPRFAVHGFRQAQTAIAAAWMLRGAPWLDYWTPVLGPPWSVPFEFPLYQWLIAGLARLTGWPLDAVAAATSYGWLLASVPPAAALMRRYALPAPTARFYAVLLLASPLYLYWGTSVMMETQAMSLGVIFVWALHIAMTERRAWAVALAVLAGAGAALTKITTFMPFLVASGGIVLWRMRRDERWGGRTITAVLGLVMALPGLLAFTAWNAHADALKSLNPLASVLRSDAPHMIAWNFGPVAQRWSPEMLGANGRALVDCFGLAGPVLLVLLGWRLAKAIPGRRAALAIAALVFLYALPWLVLTNLHVVHAYYQTANGLFAIGAVAVALGALADSGREPLAAWLCLAFVGSDWATYVGRSLTRHDDLVTRRERLLAEAVAPRTSPDSVLLTYGLDWSPVVPYLSARLARMEPPWTTPASYRARLPALDPSPIDGHPVGAIIRCPSQVEDDPVAVRRLVAIERHWPTTAVADCLVSFAPFSSEPQAALRSPDSLSAMARASSTGSGRPK